MDTLPQPPPLDSFSINLYSILLNQKSLMHEQPAEYHPHIDSQPYKLCMSALDIRGLHF